MATEVASKAHDSALTKFYKESKELQVDKPTKESVQQMQKLAGLYNDRLKSLKSDPSQYSQVEKEELTDIINTAKMGLSMLNQSSDPDQYWLLFAPTFWSKFSHTVGS